MRPKFHVSLVILDEDEHDLPEEITRRTGILPSRTWRKGEVKAKTILKHKDNGWELKSSLPLESPLTEHINSLLATIEPMRQELKGFTSKHFSLLACAVYFDEETPELHLGNELISQLAMLNLSLDIDLYCTA
jgi:hypothetical protein